MARADPPDEPAGGTAEAQDLRGRRALLWLIAPITVILVFWALRATASLFVPLILSVFLALLVAPVDRAVAGRMTRRFRWVGHLAAMSVILLAGLVFVGSIWIAAEQVVGRFSGSEGPDPGGAEAGQEALLPDALGDLLQGGAPADPGGPDAAGTGPDADADADAGPAGGAQEAGGQGGLTQASDRVTSRILAAIGGAGFDLGSRIASWASGLAGNLLAAAGSILGGVFLVFFLTLLLLIESGKWRSKADALLRRRARRDTLESVGVIASRLRAYLLARTVVGLVTAVLYVGWLWIFGVDLLIVWGLLVFLLNYIPTLGSLIGGVLPVIYAFVYKDPGTAALVAAGLLVIEQVMGNFVDPRVQGRQVSISPSVVLLALVFWGWVWGVVGLFLAVPVTVALMIVFAHVAALRPVALLLSNETDLAGLDRMAGRDAGS